MVCCAVARQQLATPTRPAYRGACLKVKPHLQATPNKGRGSGRGQNMASNKGESLKFGNTFPCYNRSDDYNTAYHWIRYSVQSPAASPDQPIQ